MAQRFGIRGFPAWLLLALALLLPMQARAAGTWQDFKAAFITADGRVVDPFNNSMSHSEGQGFAMLLAVAHDDAQAFDLLWQWTRDNLQLRCSDSLLAWSFGQRLPGQWRVMDLNNASDGDILTAFALLRAWEAWHKDEYRQAALTMVKDMRELLVAEQQGQLCLLPGYFGFHDDARMRLNPSYVVHPALDLFARHDQEAFWLKLKTDSLDVLSLAMRGRQALPPDWIVVDGSGAMQCQASETSPGLESVRVILYLAWDRNLGALPGLDQVLEQAAEQGSLSMATDTGQTTLSLDSMPGGFLAVLARAAQDLGLDAQAQSLDAQARAKLAQEEKDYYSQALALLADLPMP